MSCFWTHLGNQKIFHKNSVLSDRFYYNILGNVITAGSPHKNQRTAAVLPGIWTGHWTRLPKAEIGAVVSPQDSESPHVP